MELQSIEKEKAVPDRSACMGIVNLSSEKSTFIRSGCPDANRSYSAESSSVSVIPEETGRA